ncbi:ABC transporter substrate-binding protein [Paenibacillaceae bacterium WGS1546]|uniref:ABC transporter substrate-binding protein n=1 Tax=Cohnella sp. WGS1546 TaxID=3366810 RepID=UPI00372CE7D5
MNQTSKASLLMGIVILLSVVMAACTSNNKNAATPAPSNPAATASGTSSASTISGDLEIQYFVGGYGDAWWKEVIQGFKEKYPDVNVIEQAGPNINEQMKTRWISDSPPDIVYIDGAGSSEAQMVSDGQLMDLTEWVQSIKLGDGTPLMDNFIVPPSQYEGNKIYSLPLLFDTRGTWYDKRWFEQEGFQVPEDFAGWLESMKAIKEKANIHPLTTTGVYPSVFMKGVLYPAIGSAGGNELLSDAIKGVEGAWSSDEMLSVVTKIQQIQEAGLVDPGFAAITHTEAQMNFLLHKNAFVPVGFWLPNEMRKDIPADFEFGIIPTPMNDAGQPMVVIPDLRPLAIAEKAKNPEAAKAFFQFVFQKEYAVKFSELTGAMMNMKGIDLDSNPNVPAYLKNANALINDPAKVTLNFLPHPMNASLEKPIGDAMVSLLLGEIDAAEFTKKAEAAAKSFRDSQ